MTLVLAYLLIACAQVISRGRFEPQALALVLLGVAVAAWGSRPRSAARAPIGREPLVLCGAALALVALAHPPLTYVGGEAWVATYRLGMLVALAGVASYLVQDLPPIVRALRFAVLLTLVVAARLLVPIVSPTPGEDVWFVQQEAAAAALRGLDPYRVAYSQIFAPEVYEAFGYRSGFHYPPMTLLAIVPTFALTGDIRWIHVLCECFALWALWRTAGETPALRGERRELLLWLWGLNASILFVLEHAWTEPIGLALLAGLIRTSAPGSPRRFGIWPAALCLAAFFSFKQYTLLLAPLLLFLEPRAPVLACFATLNVLSYLPWLVTAPGGLVSSLMEPWRARPRPDGLSLAALWIQFTGVPLGAWAGGLAMSGAMHAAMVGIARSRRGLLLAIAAVLGALFLTAKQSFCNYYYLLGYVILLAAVLPERETDESEPGALRASGRTGLHARESLRVGDTEGVRPEGASGSSAARMAERD